MCNHEVDVSVSWAHGIVFIPVAHGDMVMSGHRFPVFDYVWVQVIIIFWAEFEGLSSVFHVQNGTRPAESQDHITASWGVSNEGLVR
jgi:hypothetical protein